VFSCADQIIQYLCKEIRRCVNDSWKGGKEADLFFVAADLAEDRDQCLADLVTNLKLCCGNLRRS